jgi:hypothetical protein
MMDIYDGTPWTEMGIEDLRDEIAASRSIEEAAQFLCRADSVEEKCRELGLPQPDLRGRTGPLPLLTTGIRPIPRHRLHRA